MEAYFEKLYLARNYSNDGELRDPYLKILLHHSVTHASEAVKDDPQGDKLELSVTCFIF